MAFRALYEKVQKAHRLPPYEELDAEFDLDGIPETTCKPLREVAKRVFERTDAFRKILEPVLNPETVLDMQETQALSDQERQRTTDILTQLMQIDRALLLAELENTEDAYAAFARDAIASWKGIKPDLKKLVQAMHATWGKRRDVREMLHYLG